MKQDGMFRQLVEDSDDVIIVTDADFHIQYISGSVVKIFGLEPVSVIGKNVFDFVSPNKINSWKKYIEGMQSPFSKEISLTIAKGNRAYFDVQVSNYGQRQLQGLVLRLHDITHKKQKEHELQRSVQQMDQVIYKTTHDLKAPLMSALGLVTLAEKASPDEKPVYIELIKKSLLKLNSFIEEMNNFFRNEKLALQRDRIDMHEIFRDELEDLQNLSSEFKIDISLDIQANTDFYSDLIRIRTIITNILSNAIKYSDPKKADPFIRINVSVNEEFCEISIADNGIGIDSQYQEKIFNLFFRATDHSQGTGLGLFIVKDTIQKLAGRIEVNSTLGQGTIFTVQIPNQISQPIEVA
jgi:PAS domain S-box-containing protein